MTKSRKSFVRKRFVGHRAQNLMRKKRD